MLRLVLDSHSRISCGPETRFLADMRAHRRPGLGTAGPLRVPPRVLAGAASRDFFGGIHADYAGPRGQDPLGRQDARCTRSRSTSSPRSSRTRSSCTSSGTAGTWCLAPQAVRLLVGGQVRGEVAALHPRRPRRGPPAARRPLPRTALRGQPSATRRRPCGRCSSSSANPGRPACSTTAASSTTWRASTPPRADHTRGPPRDTDAPIYGSRVGTLPAGTGPVPAGAGPGLLRRDACASWATGDAPVPHGAVAAAGRRAGARPGRRRGLLGRPRLPPPRPIPSRRRPGRRPGRGRGGPGGAQPVRRALGLVALRPVRAVPEAALRLGDVPRAELV